jgi:hypothetical protein
VSFAGLQDFASLMGQQKVSQRSKLGPAQNYDESNYSAKKCAESLQTLSSHGGDALHPALRIRGAGLRD